MQSISQLSVILHCLCYVIIISYLALHCPKSLLIIHMLYPKIAQIYAVSLKEGKVVHPSLHPPPHHLWGGGGGGGVTCAAGGKGGNFPEDNANYIYF